VLTRVGIVFFVVAPCHNIAASLQTGMFSDGEFNFLLYTTKPERESSVVWVCCVLYLVLFRIALILTGLWQPKCVLVEHAHTLSNVLICIQIERVNVRM